MDTEFVESLRKNPKTYKMILGSDYDNRNTITNVVRKKVGRLIDFGIIHASILPGTRFGERIFFHPEKEYFIVTTRHKQTFSYWYCKDIHEEKSEVVLVDAYIIESGVWIPKGTTIVKREWVIKWL